MRTRFLAADYFAPVAADASSSDQALAVAALPFPSLPDPVLPPDPYLPDPDPFPADLLPYPSVSGDDIYSFPVANALSDFLAAVIPRPLPVPDIPDADEGEGVVDDFLYGRGGNGKGFSRTDPVACDVPKARELLKEFKFEVIEIDFLQDFIDMDTEITIPYPVELAESIYHVEKIPVKQDVDGDCSDARDSDCLEIAKLDHDVMIPQLEISRHAWELDECSTKPEISNIFLSVVEHLNDGSQVPHPAFDSTEFLKSDVDMLSLVCKDAPHVGCQTDESITAKAVAEMDLVKINGNILLDKKSAIYPLKPDGTCSDLPCFVRLEEVEIVEFPSKDAFEMLAESEKSEMNTSDEIFKNDFDSARRFYESVVSSELALSDGTFKSLPVPILTDDEEMTSVLPLIEEVLSSLKPLPLSAADGIFLDWHLLLEGPCNREICSTYASMVEEVKPCSVNSELKICQQTSDLGIDFLGDFQRSPKVRHEDRKNEVYVPATLSHDPPSIPETAHKYRKENDDRDQSHLEKLKSEKASSLFESMSRSDGLNFYLNGRSDTNGVKNNEIVATLDIPPSKQQAIPVSTRPKVDKLIEIYPVTPSDLIRGLIKDIHVSYTSALRESAYLRNFFSDEQGLGISKQKLLELITGEGSRSLYNGCKLEEKMELIVLYALKQIAYYLCFFGLHAAHLYIGNLTGSFENIPERLRNIQCCIGEAQQNVERQLLESHPSLSSIEAILRSNTQIGQKILIVSDRAFWPPLGQKLTSMKMTSVELGKYPAATYADPLTETSSKAWALKDLWKSDCILLDNKAIPALFPFCEFGIILEYGGPNESSTLLSLAPKLNSLPPLHFMYVKMDAEDFPVAFIEDNCTDKDLKSTVDAVLHTLQKDLQEKMNKMRIVDSLNFIPATNQEQHLQEKLSQHFTADLSTKLPVDGQLNGPGNQGEKNIVGSHNFVPPAEQLKSLNKITTGNLFVSAIEKSSSTSSVSANVIKVHQDNISASDFPSCVKIDSIMSGRFAAPEVVIVVNTGNHGKCMLFSRRSSYQQILALEKEGMQVVERDVNLPVDLILSPAICLVWYDVRSFRSSDFTASSETPSIADFIEDIVTDTLMPLSFSFSGCIMVIGFSVLLKKRKKSALQDVSVPINDPLRANTLNQLCGDYVEHDKIFSPSKMKKFSNMEDTFPEFPEVFKFDHSLNLGSEHVSHQQGKRGMNAVTGNQRIYDDFNNVLTPNLRTYNERTNSIVDICNYSSQSEFGGTKPIQSAFATRRPSLDRACGHRRFPTALEINNDIGEWDIPCGINETRSGQLHGDFATSSCRDYPGSRYHESGEEMMQNPASSLAFMKQDFGSNPTSQGLGWERDFLRQMNERRISRQGRDRCKASAMLSNPRMRDGSSRILHAPPVESFRYQRNARTPSKDQSPSSNGAHSYGPTGSVRYQITIDTPVRDQGPSDGAHRYGKSREGAKVQSNRVRRDFMIQPSINHEKSIIPSIEPSWTPVDKRARQKLSYTTYGKEKQSKLVWRHQGSPDVGSGFRKRYREEGT
ncbi:hypothetical protein PR202_gb09203 [Eleusine coracana subsp. coracana]|uniref:Uncharacterized protein n=1 Tax=Eleusine coracana subsp. coracana TaxID=191504 RepID=A0AAV5EHE3_ELECO|nr:hypothetical protein PR202_gb09203 [Eleusine coracana subsp. coracana]